MIVFPNRCVACEGWLESNPLPLCDPCNTRLNFLKTLAHLPSLKKCYFESAHSSIAYQGLSLELIHRYKYHRQFYLIPLFAHFLESTALDWNRYDGFTYVPSHWWQRLRRGFNPSHLLAHTLAKKKSKPICHALKKSKRTEPQAKLSKEERLKNVQETFFIRPNQKSFVANKTILLIDDVLTTGSTVNECARALKKAGAKQVDVLTLARTL